MASTKAHPGEGLIRYLDGELSGDELNSIREHLRTCTDCRNLAEFSETFTQNVSELNAEDVTSKEPCPSAFVLAEAVEGELDEETAGHVRAHLLFCDDCSELYFAARSIQERNWTRVVIRALEGVWDSIAATGTGRVLAPAPAVSTTRGEAPVRTGSAQIEAEVSNPKTGATAIVRLLVNASPNRRDAAVLVDVLPLQDGWRATLLDARGEELAGTPLNQQQTPLASRLPFGDYVVTIHEEADRLATFELDIRPR